MSSIKGTRVEVRASRDTLRLARLSGVPFTDRLVSKFDLPVVGWREHANRSRSAHGEATANDGQHGGQNGCDTANARRNGR